MPTTSNLYHGQIDRDTLPMLAADLSVPSHWRPDINKNLIYCRLGTSRLILPDEVPAPQHIVNAPDGSAETRIGYEHPAEGALIVWNQATTGVLLLARRQAAAYAIQYSAPLGITADRCIIMTTLKAYIRNLEAGALPALEGLLDLPLAVLTAPQTAVVWNRLAMA